MKLTPLLATPVTVTSTFPLVAPAGTATTIEVAVQLVIVVAVVPLNFTVLVPGVAPKFVPVIVTGAPTAPEVTDRLVMVGVGSTVKLIPLVFTPAVFTTTFPVVAPAGTATAIEVAVQLVTDAVVPLNFTVPVPWGVTKFVPVIVTGAPTAPEVTDRLVMVGVGSTVNGFPLLATPLTVTTTLPVVAPVGTLATMDVVVQLVIVVAVVPLNFTVLVPGVAPKFVPVIVTDAPAAPEVGERLVMLGAANATRDEKKQTTTKARSCNFGLMFLGPSPDCRYLVIVGNHLPGIELASPDCLRAGTEQGRRSSQHQLLPLAMMSDRVSGRHMYEIQGPCRLSPVRPVLSRHCRTEMTPWSGLVL